MRCNEKVRIALAFEFLVLFVLLPAAFALRPFPIPALPVLWAVTAYCYVVLRRQPQFEAPKFWDRQALAAWWRRLGASETTIRHAFRNFNANAPAFRVESERHEH